ncbi:MAG: 3'-5' exonuclease [SAR202 cluster bacterium]|nr:3'-5' exonuclease [SAR202 cluster bacterium]|tara:strand:- start:24984 stop:25658 length:675 start_codon:yes stop_codon:yes gene_type:complete
MNRDIIVFDFETGGRNPLRCQPTQIAAIALDGRNFRLKGEFNSMMRPIIDDDEAIAAGVDPLEEGALKVTGQTRSKLARAPLPKGVWKKFCNFVNKYNWKGTPYFAPIPAGFNIIGYDMHIVNRLCKEYGPWDEKRQSQKLFHQIYKIDVMDDVWLWTEGDPNVKSISMDSLRERMGLSGDNAHDALQDVKDTANIFIKLQKSRRAVYRNMKFDKAFADGNLYV